MLAAYLAGEAWRLIQVDRWIRRQEIIMEYDEFYHYVIEEMNKQRTKMLSQFLYYE